MLIIEDKIDWEKVMSAPRYAGGHEEVMDSMFGEKAEVISTYHDHNWSGEIAWAYKFPNGEVAIMTDYYGSCSGCDLWEDCGDNQARDMIMSLCGSAKIFNSTADAKEWCDSMNPENCPWDFPWRAAKKLFKGAK